MTTTTTTTFSPEVVKIYKCERKRDPQTILYFLTWCWLPILYFLFSHVCVFQILFQGLAYLNGFFFKANLKAHIRSTHNTNFGAESISTTGSRVVSSSSSLSCPSCSFRATSRQELKKHSKTKHLNANKSHGEDFASLDAEDDLSTCSKDFKCDACGAEFVQPDSYRAHRKQHEKERAGILLAGRPSTGDSGKPVTGGSGERDISSRSALNLNYNNSSSVSLIIAYLFFI